MMVTARRDSGPRHISLGSLGSRDQALAIVGDPESTVSGIAYDSRQVTSGDLFVALRGGYFDGHQFVREARDRGATALLVEEAVDIALPQILAANSRAALAGIAARFFDDPSAEVGVVGVTGTDGKTTTCYLIDEILRSHRGCTGMIGTVAVRIGEATVAGGSRQTTPESVEVQRYLRQMADAGVAWAVVEATSHGLDMHRLDHVRFRVGAVTNITHEHLDYHRTIAAYRRAKGILFERVAADGGVAVINLDDEGAREMLRFAEGACILTYAMHDERAEIRATDIVSDVSGSRFTLHVGGQALACTLPMVGGFNVANALCAAGVGVAAGVPAETIRDALNRAPAVPGRMTRIDEGQPFAVIVDYAHTPDSLTKVIQLLRGLNPTERIIVVSGSAGERDVEKRPRQGAVCARMADFSVFTTEDPRFEDPDSIIAEITAGAAAAGGVEGESFLRITDRRQAVERALRSAAPGDIVLLAGKGHEQSIIWGLEKRPWDEERVAREILRDLGYSAMA